ncbi:lazarillo protein-like [Ischnura elegans]|uniref:lazarillo protein-like n=1 Tax=Ischnura elegans TaxID=197161 RepID=UPI001ED8BA88|nr:lazarillo protein-like [Ischnura elegans]
MFFRVHSTLVLGVAAILFGCNVEAISRFAGSCPKLDAVSFFNPNVFKGEWFEYGSFFPIFDSINRCTKFTFSDPTFGVMKLDISGKNMLNFQMETRSGTAAVTGSSGTLSMTFPSLAPFPSQYLILGTDYASWAVLWTCQERPSDNIQNVIILTRQQAPPQFTVNSALRNIDSNSLSRFNFKPVDQSYC